MATMYLPYQNMQDASQSVVVKLKFEEAILSVVLNQRLKKYI